MVENCSSENDMARSSDVSCSKCQGEAKTVDLKSVFEEENALVDEYLARCKRYSSAVEVAVVACLQTKARKMICVTDSALLSLCTVLPKATFVRELCLSRKKAYSHSASANGEGTTFCLLLSELLPFVKHIEVIDLSFCGINSDAVEMLLQGIKKTWSVKRLLLRSNYLNSNGCELVIDLLKEQNRRMEKKLMENDIESWSYSHGLELIDISFNSAGSKQVKELSLVEAESASITQRFKGIQQLSSGQHTGCVLMKAGNCVTEEIWNSISHGLGVILAFIVSCVFLGEVFESWRVAHGFVTIGICVFIAATLTLLLSSTLYHSFFLLETTNMIFRILDHAAIFLMIAGSYTPFLSILICTHWAGGSVENNHQEFFHQLSLIEIVLFALIFQWSAAFLGVFCHVIAYHYKLLTNPWYEIFELVLYISMGIMAGLFWPLLQLYFSSTVCGLILLGGFFYLAGVPFFILGNYTPIMHLIWHVFVTIAAMTHFASVWVAYRNYINMLG